MSETPEHTPVWRNRCDDPKCVYDHHHCAERGCERFAKNHRWGTIKADAWFFQRDGTAWCAEHHPPWVAEWRAKKGKAEPSDEDLLAPDPDQAVPDPDDEVL